LVRTGETVEVTDRGSLVALLVPPGPAMQARDRLVASGRMIPGSNPTGRVRSPHPVRARPGEPTNQELLDAEREERI
jgi:antitoxin (DNA-binding transcriptional repressor) of toxin-antitoxin stability system